MKHRKSDILWKVVMEEVFDDLLRFVFDDADEVYNMERGFEFLEKELAEMDPEPAKESDTRFADKLVKVFHRDGTEEWILTHVEIQGDTSQRSEFSLRMFRYFYRIFDRYRRPVSAIVIYTGQDGRKMPSRFDYQYRNTRLRYEYHTLSILDFADEELDLSANPFAQVVLAAKTALLEEKIPEQALLERKVLIASKLLRRGFQSRKVRAIMKFLENYVLFDDPDLNRIFIKRIKTQDKSNIMGIDEYIKQEAREEAWAEARAEAILEERERFVESLLNDSNFPVEKIASLANVTVEFVNKIRNDKKIK